MEKVYNRIYFVSKAVVIFFFGGTSYYALELLFRGRSHFSMVLCEGACFSAIYIIGKYRRKLPLIYRALLCAAAITSIEFTTGVIVNLWLGLKVWDYSARPFNFFGQVCLEFSLLWWLLSFPALGICKAFDTYICGDAGTLSGAA